MLTSKQLVAWAEAALAAKAKYWYGTCWYRATEDLLRRKAKQYPSHYTAGRMDTYRSHIKAAYMVCDCVGLIKGFFWTDNGTTGNNYASNGCPDTSANGMIALCKKQGDMGTMPDVPGIVLWREGHIGVYVGGGYAIEARGFAYGVVRTKVSGRGWHKWGYLPILDYGAADTPAAATVTAAVKRATVRKGGKGADVKAAQELLLKWDGKCLPKYGADGDFGGETDRAVRAFQKAKQLTADGIVGPKTWAALEGTGNV